MAVEALARHYKAEYYQLGVSVETPFNINGILESNPHFGKLVDLCLQTFEGNPPREAKNLNLLPQQKQAIMVYQNGDNPYRPADNKRLRYFTIDPDSQTRIEEIDPSAVYRTADQFLTLRGESISVKEIPSKGNSPSRYLLLNEQRQVVTEGEGAKAKAVLFDPQKEGVAYFKKSQLVTNINGLEIEVKDYTERQILKEEVAQLVASYCQDLITEPEKDGTVQQWMHIFDMAPAMVALLTDARTHVEAVQKSQALNIIDAALKVSRKPETRIKIKAGFGASDDEQISTVYAANALPALDMAAKIKAYSDHRKAQGKQALNFDPEVELVFASEAGIRANFPDEAESIRQKTDHRIAAVTNFAQTFYPEITVRVFKDKPWEKQNYEVRERIQQFAGILLDHPSETIQTTLDQLVKFGRSKGNNASTRVTAAEYAAIHPNVWGFRFGENGNDYLTGEAPADVIVRIGPRTEAHFDAMILAILEDPQVNRLVAADHPTMVLMTGRIGDHCPTYFFQKGVDEKEGYPIHQHLDEITSRLQQLDPQIKERASQLKAEGIDLAVTPDQQLRDWAEERSSLLGRIYDIKAFINASINRIAMA